MCWLVNFFHIFLKPGTDYFTIEKAIEAVGNNREKVEEYLKKSRT
jgi:hypothetical protein